MTVPFKPVEVDKTKLLDWIQSHHNEDDMRELFLNMDIALKYIHDHGYCIEIFHPSRIEILNDQVDHIQFDNLMELSQDSITRKEMIKEDIFNSALIQIGIYTNTIRSLTPTFLRENFDEIARFLPEGDVPYYRGVVQRGASVYFNEYALEKMNRDLIQLDKQIQESEGGPSLQKDNGHYTTEPLSNDRINDDIYKQINGMKDVAFVSYLLVPTIAFISLFLIALVGWIISLF
jgi:hypothetical protein